MQSPIAVGAKDVSLPKITNLNLFEKVIRFLMIARCPVTSPLNKSHSGQIKVPTTFPGIHQRTKKIALNKKMANI